MKFFFQILALLASVLMMVQTEDDGKYHPETTVTTLRTVPTTRLPITVPTVYPGWNSRRSWPYDRYDPRYDGRFDTRPETRFDTRINGNYNPYNPYITNGELLKKGKKSEPSNSSLAFSC